MNTKVKRGLLLVSALNSLIMGMLIIALDFLLVRDSLIKSLWILDRSFQSLNVKDANMVSLHDSAKGMIQFSTNLTVYCVLAIGILLVLLGVVLSLWRKDLKLI